MLCCVHDVEAEMVDSVKLQGVAQTTTNKIYRVHQKAAIEDVQLRDMMFGRSE